MKTCEECTEEEFKKYIQDVNDFFCNNKFFKIHWDYGAYWKHYNLRPLNFKGGNWNYAVEPLKETGAYQYYIFDRSITLLYKTCLQAFHDKIEEYENLKSDIKKEMKYYSV